MKIKRTFYLRFLKALFTGMMVFSLAVVTGCKEKNPQTLKQVMSGLEKDMTAINSAIYQGDFASIESHAKAIADHPKPMKEQRKKILEHLGERIERFQGYDFEVHSSATKLAEAALAHRVDQVVEFSLNVQKGCMNCHIEFQKEISELLADTPQPSGEAEPAPEVPEGSAPSDSEVIGD